MARCHSLIKVDDSQRISIWCHIGAINISDSFFAYLSIFDFFVVGYISIDTSLPLL